MKKIIVLISIILVLLLFCVLFSTYIGDFFESKHNCDAAVVFHRVHYTFFRKTETLVKIYNCIVDPDDSFEVIKSIIKDDEYFGKLTVDEQQYWLEQYYISMYVARETDKFWNEIGGFYNEINDIDLRLEMRNSLLYIIQAQPFNTEEDYINAIKLANDNLIDFENTDYIVEKRFTLDFIVNFYRAIGNDEKADEYHEMAKELWITVDN